MRIGGPLIQAFSSPEQWIAELRRKGYRSAYAPVGAQSPPSEREEYRQAAEEADVVIAEVGAWSNPLSPDRSVAAKARETIVNAIRLGDDLGARCVVNIAGSRGQKWDGPFALDYAPETFDAIVTFVQGVLDETDPARTSYSLEPMPWMYPDSTESYQRLVKQIDRPGFRVHYDAVNMINSPEKLFRCAEEVNGFVEALGPQIASVHAKDITLGQGLTVHLDECIAGLGEFDFDSFLRALDTLDPDLPVLVEHLKTEEEYDQAVAHIRSVADRLDLQL